MTCKILDATVGKSVINDLAPHPLQSWEWGEARKKMGIEVLRFGEYEGDQLINVFQVTFHKVPYSPFTIGYLPRSIFPSEVVLEM